MENIIGTESTAESQVMNSTETLDSSFHTQDLQMTKSTAGESSSPPLEMERPQCIRIAALCFLGQVLLSALSLRLSESYLVPEAVLDSVVCLSVTGYIVYKLYQMKPWAVFAYALVQFLGLVALPSVAHMPFLGFLTGIGNIALAVWVWVTTEDLRKEMNWDFIKKLKL